MKYKRKIKASGGAAFITMAQGGQDLWQTNSQTMLDRYGYKDQPGKSSYSLIGTSRQRAGSTTGAYTDLSKYTSTPAQKVKSKDFGLLNTLNTVVGIGSALVSGSADALQGSMDTSKTATDPKTAPEAPSTQLPFEQNAQDPNNIGVYPNKSLVDVGKSMGTTNFSTPNTPENEFPSLITSQPDTPKAAGFEAERGMINKKGAVPVEAEGGEMDIHFNDNYDILDTKPIVGASHESGGVDVKLPKNHAILNKDQLARLKGGEPLKSIISSLPDVKNVGKARPGTVNDNPDEENPGGNWLERQGRNMASGFLKTIPPTIAGWMGLDANSGTSTKSMETIYAPNDPNAPYVPQYLPYPPDEGYETSLLSGTAPKTPGSAGFDETGTPKGQPGKNVVETGLDMSPITLEGMSGKERDAALNNMPGNKPSLVNTGMKLPDDPQRWKFGYPEEKAIGDVFSNMLALFQPRPKGVTVPTTHVGTPTMVTPRFMNAKATLAEVGKQINSGVKVLTQSGRSDMVPSLISAGIDASNKVGEQFAVANAGMESQALATNAGESNRFSLTQSGIDAQNADKNAELELMRLRQEGLQDTERYKSLVNLMYLPSEYEKTKQDEQMRNAVRARLLVNMYSGRT